MDSIREPSRRAVHTLCPSSQDWRTQEGVGHHFLQPHKPQGEGPHPVPRWSLLQRTHFLLERGILRASTFQASSWEWGGVGRKEQSMRTGGNQLSVGKWRLRAERVLGWDWAWCVIGPCCCWSRWQGYQLHYCLPQRITHLSSRPFTHLTDLKQIRELLFFWRLFISFFLKSTITSPGMRRMSSGGQQPLKPHQLGSFSWLLLL